MELLRSPARRAFLRGAGALAAAAGAGPLQAAPRRDVVVLTAYPDAVAFAEAQDGSSMPIAPRALVAIGSATDDGGNPSGGQACKAMRLFLFLREDDMIPMIVALPPTSLQNAKKYFLRLVANGYPYYGLTTQIRLEQLKNPKGKPYSRATLNKGRDLKPEEFANAKVIGQAMKDLFDQASQVIDADSVAE